MIQVDDEIRELFLDKVKQLLINGESIQTHKTTKLRKTVTGSSFNGDPIEQLTESVQTTRQTQLLPTPAWVYDLLIKSMSVENAISMLQREGYVVVDPSRIEDSDELVDNTQGLSEFAVSEISAKLLGLEV